MKVFVLNNNGYLSIRTSQKGFFGGTVGESPASGVSFPDMVAVAQGYGLPAIRMDMQDFAPAIRKVLETPGPIVCDVLLDPDQGFEPRQSSRQLPDGRIVSAPLEDMFPFLYREELAQNMLIAPWEDPIHGFDFRPGRYPGRHPSGDSACAATGRSASVPRPGTWLDLS